MLAAKMGGGSGNGARHDERSTAIFYDRSESAAQFARSLGRLKYSLSTAAASSVDPEGDGMFHRVPVADVRLGMYIVSIDCSWLNSPFWRSRFLLRDPTDLLRLQQSGIEMVTIDDTRGKSA